MFPTQATASTAPAFDTAGTTHANTAPAQGVLADQAFTAQGNSPRAAMHAPLPANPQALLPGFKQGSNAASPRHQTHRRQDTALFAKLREMIDEALGKAAEPAREGSHARHCKAMIARIHGKAMLEKNPDPTHPSIARKFIPNQPRPR